MSNSFYGNTFETPAHKMHTPGTGSMATRNFERNMMFVQKTSTDVTRLEMEHKPYTAASQCNGK